MLVPGEVISAIINGTDELLKQMRDMGVGIYATGGETADVGDLVRTIIVDSTVTCRMKRADVIDNANIRPGDVIVGLASFGQASYEDRYNGGMGSNGLTSARHDVFAKYLAEKYPESFDHAVPDELVYSGSYRLDDKVEGASVNAGQLVLSPTRTYAPVIKKILDLHRADIHGMVHCTGGAQTKVLHFVGDNCHVVKDNMFPVPLMMGVTYLDPVEVGNRVAAELKHDKKCDVVICVSHLGWLRPDEMGDQKLLASSKDIDLVLGGHSHSYFKALRYVNNADGKAVPVDQNGKNAMYVGKLTLSFDKK